MNPPQSEVDYGVVNFSGVNWIVRGKTKLVNLSRCQLNSKHDTMNLLAACAIAEAAGYPVKNARTMVTQFAGLPYRCSTEGEWNGVRWVNDARSTNVGAALAAIESNSRPVVLIAGGLSKGADFSLIPEKSQWQIARLRIFRTRPAQNQQAVLTAAYPNTMLKTSTMRSAWQTN